MPKFVAVVGGKHSGKTTIIQQLITELKNRGYKTGTIKHMPRIQTLDSPAPAHDTWKHSQAGAEIIVAVPQNETVVFVKKKQKLNDIAGFLNGMDYVLLEGFSNEKIFPKIIAAKTVEEVKEYSDGLAIAVSGLIAESEEETNKATLLQIPLIKSISETKKLADIVEQKAFCILPDLIHCGECGFESCYELAKAMVADDPKAKNCPLLTGKSVFLEVNGTRVPIKDFPREIITNIVTSMAQSLNGVDDVRSLVLKIENK
ncbi:MAG: molybdopterin-guanine dinucleotide biosynthesis protein B [archaeon]